MTMTLFDARHFGPRRPAWHQLGHPNSQPAMAREAFQQAGPYDVTLRPADEPDAWKIRRSPIAVDPCYRVFGTVGRDFVLVPPDELTELWDINVRQPVETLGALWRGRCLFITTQLAPFDVRGDALDNYLILAHWLDQTGRTEVFLAPVRVVCQNTLRMAQQRASQRIVLTAGGDVRQRMAESLTLGVRSAQEYAATLRATCLRLADRRATPEDALSVLQAAFPTEQVRRTAAMELFDGAGTGMDQPATRGTLWGLYNAVAELENFREGDTLEQAASSVLFGSRGSAIQRAFAAAVRRCAAPSTDVPHVAEALQREPGSTASRSANCAAEVVPVR